jgi:hypothetical protein
MIGIYGLAGALMIACVLLAIAGILSTGETASKTMLAGAGICLLLAVLLILLPA